MSFLLESPTLTSTSTPYATMPGSASTTDGLARHTIDFTERLEKLGRELDISDDDSDDEGSGENAANTPQGPAFFTEPLRSGKAAHTSAALVAQPSKPNLAVTTHGPVPDTGNGLGLELLSSKRYTPTSASSAGSMLSPASAAWGHRSVSNSRSPSRPPGSGAEFSSHASTASAPTELPSSGTGVQRTQSLSARNFDAGVGREGRFPAVSRVNSVKNMWERRASLLGDARMATPPQIAPLRLQRTRTDGDVGSRAGISVRDRLVEAGYGYVNREGVGSPLSPPVRAY
jgi:hypothetical protein